MMNRPFCIICFTEENKNQTICKVCGYNKELPKIVPKYPKKRPVEKFNFYMNSLPIYSDEEIIKRQKKREEEKP